MYSGFFRKIIFPIIELCGGTKIQKYLDVLNKTQWLRPYEIEELQNKKLQALVKHAYENVPYYRRLFKRIGLKPDDIKTKEDLIKIPP